MVLTDMNAKRHPLRCLFFVGALLMSPWVVSRALASSDCLAGAEAQAVRITDITDGDSLVVDGNIRLRLIGINAPELHAADRQTRALARQARDALHDFLQGRQAVMIIGQEARDVHGRILAHVRLTDGRSAAHALVAEGLASAVAVGANSRCASSLLEVEQGARKRRLGLWQSEAFEQGLQNLSGSESGFQRVSGTVVAVSGQGRRAIVQLDNGLQIRLGRHWPGYGSTHTVVPDTLTGSKVRVRGWLNTVDGQQRMTLHHPGNLELINH